MRFSFFTPTLALPHQGGGVFGLAGQPLREDLLLRLQDEAGSPSENYDAGLGLKDWKEISGSDWRLLFAL